MSSSKMAFVERLSGTWSAGHIFAGLIGLSAGAICLIPRLTVVFLILIAILSLFVPGVQARLRRGVPLGPAVGLIAALMAYLLLNASWALEPAAAYGKIASLVAIGVCCAAAIWAIACLDSEAADAAATALLVGACVGALLLAVELASGLRVTRAIYNVIPFLRPESTKHLLIVGDRVTYIGPYILNRNVALIVLMFWPVAALLFGQTKTARRRWLASSLLAGVAVVILFSWHETSQIALAFSAVAVVATRFFGPNVRWVLAALWCAGFILVVPLASYAYHHAELHKATWLPDTARARIIIWGYTADRIPENFWFGVGVRSTRVLDISAEDGQDKPDGHVLVPRTGRHAHDLFLQSWFELGLVGTALVMLAGLLLLRRLAHVPANLRPHGFGLFAALMVIAAFSWGIWQTWLLAAYALIAIYFALTCRTVGQEASEHRPTRATPRD